MSKLEMKRCKECGKLFMPTSNKQKYCSAEHYRPCPVCGKPVFAKYLSDPARCCSGVCKAKLGKLNKEGHKLVPMPGIEKLAELKAEVEANAAVESIEAIQSYCEADVEATLTLFTERATAGTEKKKYAGLDADGWTWGHVYAVTIAQEGKEHIVKATYDYTTEQVVDLEYRFTNKKKITTIFKASK